MINTEVWFYNGLKVEPGTFRGIQNDKAVIEPWFQTGLLLFDIADQRFLWDFEEGEFLEMRLNSNIECICDDLQIST